jgi:2-keto-4-pentenoate hydratase/2-oxohepta-3-ene-1,7-dioic acid hydratase in catechol pathway
MRLVTFENQYGEMRLGVLTPDGVLDLSASAQSAKLPQENFQGMSGFLEAGDSAMSLAGSLAAAKTKENFFAPGEVRLRAPVPRPGKIIAVGLNYRDHFMETGLSELPKSPLIFAKFPNSICGPGDDIVIPAPDANVDFEAELAVVVGQRGKCIPAREALAYVAGYMPLNDVSARRWQFADKQWVRGKSCDTFCPTGPYLTTRDEVPDAHALTISTRVNGEVMQSSSTSKLIFGVPELIEYISRSITLEPGDIIATGTPEGVGAFRKPPVFLKVGDIVEVEIEKLGVLRNQVAERVN